MASQAGKRTYRALERQMEADYFVNHYQGKTRYHQYAIGPTIGVSVPGLSNEASDRYLRRSQYRPDDIVLDGSATIIIEFKWHNIIDAINRLPTYKRLLLSDPRFGDRDSTQIRLLAVIPYTTDLILTEAQTRGVDLEIFRPGYIDQVIREGFPSEQK